MSKIASIYGEYANPAFIYDMLTLAEKAKNLALCNRHKQVYLDMFSDSTKSSKEAVDFWDDRILECNEYLSKKGR